MGDRTMKRNSNDYMHLVWEDLTVLLSKGKTKTSLLNRATGFALPGRIMAIMGPSGSGKTTLLNTLSGRLSPNVITSGNVLLNGKQTSTANRNISYVTQEDHLLGSLTVKETLTYSAHLRLPSAMTNAQIMQVVEETIMKMGLEECAETKIGNWHLRGISGGEKRRLSISLEMLTEPHVMFLDEPTSGLDSASAYFVIHALKSISLDGKIVICSIHQPSSFVFDLFDDLCLLSSGQTIYFGEAKAAIQFFSDAGFPCPTRRNPSDHFLRCINTDFDKVLSVRLQSLRDYLSQGSPEDDPSLYLSTESIKQKLVEEYKNSAYSIKARKMIREISLVDEKPTSIVNMNNNNSWWKQLRILTNRSFVNMTRDLGYYWLRVLFLLLIAFGAGIMFYDIGVSNSSIITRAKFYTYFYDFFLCLCVGGLPSFFEDWKVSYYERLNKHYGEGVFVVANFLSSFPFLALGSLSAVVVLYSLVKFHMGFSIFCYFFINIFLCISIMESVTMIIALLVPNFLMGIGVSAAVIMFVTIAAGLYKPLSELPKFFWRYPMSYISFTSWAVKGQYKNDMIGLEFETPEAGEAKKMKGEQVLQIYLGIDSKQSKWWDLGFVLLLFLCHRIVFFMVLKYKNRVVFLWGRRHWMKQSTDQIGKKPSFSSSFRNIPSKRHQPLHPLSSQEGLTSPLQ